MANYPDWVMAHKKKGTYINCVKGKYYLYAAHSVRVPGTGKVRRVSDGYIGRITEEEGLIPARDKVSGGEVTVYEYGLCMTMLALCADIHKGLRREFRDAADRILVSGLLLAAYGCGSSEAFKASYLSVKFPGINLSKGNTDKQHTAVERCSRMANDVMKRKFGTESDIAVTRLSRIYRVMVNGRIYNSVIGDETKEWLTNFNVDWGE